MKKERDSTLFLYFVDVQDRLNHLDDKKNQRLQFLRTKFKDTYNAVMWLRDHQDMFEKSVHEPIMLLVNTVTTVHA